MDNRKLTHAYIAAALKAGAQFREGVSADSIAVTGSRATGVRLHDGTTLEADLMIVAAGSWSHQIQALRPTASRSIRCVGRCSVLRRAHTYLYAIFSSARISFRAATAASRRLDHGGGRLDKTVTLAGIEKMVHGPRDDAIADRLPFRRPGRPRSRPAT